MQYTHVPAVHASTYGQTGRWTMEKLTERETDEEIRLRTDDFGRRKDKRLDKCESATAILK